MTEIKSKVTAAMSKASKPGTLAGLNSTNVMTVLESMKAQISMALPKHLTPDRMLSIATTVISQNPKLAECSAQSLVGAVMQASILGFKPTPILGEVYFVPFNNKKKMPDGTEKWIKEVQVQIGYKGYVSLARRSGEIKTLYAFPVYENDEFNYQLGLNTDLTHVPAEGDRGKLTHAYAVAHYKDGGYNFIVLTKSQIESLRLRNKMQKGSPSGAWATDYEAMACAKAVKQLAKWMPLSDEMQTAVTTDEKVITDEAFTNTHEGIDAELMQDPTESFEDAEEVTHAPKKSAFEKKLDNANKTSGRTQTNEEALQEQLNKEGGTK
jgi:recombination protein RecT